MRRTVFVLVVFVALASVLAYMAPVSGQAAGEAAPLYGVTIPTGYRDWKLIALDVTGNHAASYRIARG